MKPQRKMMGRKGLGMLSLLTVVGCGAQDLEGAQPATQEARVEETSVARPVQSAAELQRMRQYVEGRYASQDI